MKNWKYCYSTTSYKLILQAMLSFVILTMPMWGDLGLTYTVGGWLEEMPMRVHTFDISEWRTDRVRTSIEPRTSYSPGF